MGMLHSGETFISIKPTYLPCCQSLTPLTGCHPGLGCRAPLRHPAYQYHLRNHHHHYYVKMLETELSLARFLNSVRNVLRYETDQ